MRNGLTLAALLFVIPLPSCKDKEAGDKAPDPAGEAINVVETPPVPETPDAQEIAKLSETAVSIFDASANVTTPFEWHLHGEQIALRAEASLSEGAKAKYDTKLFAVIPGSEETEVHSCKALSATAQGRMDLVLRGDMLHVLCINSAQSDDPGSTEAKRFAFSLGKRQFEPTGSYGGDGSLDLDTIDLDEGE